MMRKVLRKLLWALGLIVVVIFASRYVKLTSTPEGSVFTDVINVVRSKIRGEEGPDVTTYRKQTQYLAALINARNSYTAIWACATEWPKQQLFSSRSPVLRYLPVMQAQLSINHSTSQSLLADGTLIRLPTGEYLVQYPERLDDLLRAGQINSREIVGGKLQCLLQNGQWYDLDRPLSPSVEPCYWDTNFPIRVDYATVIRGGGLPAEIIPASQRSRDGLRYNTAWVYRADVGVSNLPRAPWGRGMIQTNVEPGGKRVILDRYVAVLRRGQSSQRLAYRPSLIQPWEDEEGWGRGWCLQADGGTLIANINGHPFTFTADKHTDTTEVERKDGSVILEVTLGLDSPREEVLVEFVYFRHRN